jgi:multidrug efflux pump
MSYLPITLFMVLGASIFVALIFTPALGSIFGRKAGRSTRSSLEQIHKSEQGDPREMNGFMGWYARASCGRPVTIRSGSPSSPWW